FGKVPRRGSRANPPGEWARSGGEALHCLCNAFRRRSWGETGGRDDVKGVVFEAAIGDHEVIGLLDRRCGQLSVKMEGVLGQVLLHRELNIGWSSQGFISFTHDEPS